jgi:hypothetical protein
MADVSLFEGDDRGQLMIVMSLAIALMFVSMALYLNTAIYTENLATRKGDIAGTAGAESFKSSATDATAGIVHDVNRRNNSTGYSGVESAFDEDLRNWSDAAGRLAAARSRAAVVSEESTTRGSRIVQVADRNFTNESGTADWVLAEDTADVRALRLNVSQPSLTASSPGNIPNPDTFAVNITDGTSTYEVFVYRDGSSNVAVSVWDGTDEIGPCKVDQSRAVVDVTRATVGGEHCPALEFFDNFSSDLTLTFNNTVSGGSDTVVGTYSIVVSENRPAVNDDDYATEGSTSGPFVTTAIYSATVRVAYETPRIEYVTVVRVAPGEPDG